MNKRTKKLLAMMAAPPRLRRVSGLPPLSYTAKKAGFLTDYRIYGQTSRNLFDMNAWANTITSVRGNGIMSISGNTLSITSVDMQDCYTIPYIYSAEGVYKILVKPNTNYRIQYSKSSNASVIIFENGTTSYMYTSTGPITTHSDTTFLTLRMGVASSASLGTTATISNFMISEGFTDLPYEPYGESVGDLVTSGEHAGEYKVLVTVSNDTDTLTTPIYLPEQIKKVGDEAEYIDYGEQKQYIETTDGQEKYVVGLNVDFENKTFTRLADAVGLSKGADFDNFSAFGGRRRCNVADNGTITAYYGDANYTEDGSNGQVMVYQPAFYYKVEPLKIEAQESGVGYHLRNANYYISNHQGTGFKLHPAFYNEAGDRVDYILLGAYASLPILSSPYERFIMVRFSQQ